MIHVSEALSLAFHSMAALARADGEALCVSDIARTTGGSPAHLAKVLQRLARAGLVRATRGPAGGYRLARPASAIELTELYEAIEGAAPRANCLMPGGGCPFANCIFGAILPRLTAELNAYLQGHTVADLAAAAIIPALNKQQKGDN